MTTSNDLYEWMVQLLMRDAPKLDDESLLQRIECIAILAFESAPTLLNDPRLEALIQGVAKRLESMALPPSPVLTESPRRVLHVTTGIHRVGGHTRIIMNWVRADRERRQSLVVTYRDGEITEWMRQSLAEVGCDLIELGRHGESRLERARQLRKLIREGGYELIISHHFPNDTVTFTALGVEGLPQVYVFNQGDHVYWLGVAMADAVLDFRAKARDITERVRGARRSLPLPYILEPQSDEPGREEARRIVGLQSWKTILVSMARVQKFVPCLDYNLHRTLLPVLQSHPDTVLVLIGLDRDDYLRLFKAEPPPNVLPMGRVDHPSLLLRAADIWIEPMPWGSALASFDACRHGAVPMFVYGQAPCIYGTTVSDLFEGSGCEEVTANEVEYQARLTQMIADVSLRQMLSAKVKAFCKRGYLSPGWNDSLNAAYQQAVGGKHQVNQLGLVCYENTPSFQYYSQCMSEDLAKHAALCMRLLEYVVRWRDLIWIVVFFVIHRLRNPSLSGCRCMLRFVKTSLLHFAAHPSAGQLNHG